MCVKYMLCSSLTSLWYCCFSIAYVVDLTLCWSYSCLKRTYQWCIWIIMCNVLVKLSINVCQLYIRGLCWNNVVCCSVSFTYYQSCRIALPIIMCVSILRVIYLIYGPVLSTTRSWSGERIVCVMFTIIISNIH